MALPTGVGWQWRNSSGAQGEMSSELDLWLGAAAGIETGSWRE